MATLVVRSHTAPDGTRTPAELHTDGPGIAYHLRQIGVYFETWGADRLPRGLAGRNLSDADKQQILSAYAPEIERMAREGGYSTKDVVTLYPDTPDLPVLLAKFDKRHLHSDDEVRFCVAGRGIFSLFPDNAPAHDVEIHPGDYISVPKAMKHLFTLCPEQQMTCVRLFAGTEGWVAQYC